MISTKPKHDSLRRSELSDPSGILDELICLVPIDGVYCRNFLFVKVDAVELVRLSEHLGAEGRGDELSRFREGVDHCLGGVSAENTNAKL